MTIKQLLKRANRLIPDKLYLQMKYKQKIHRKLDLANPKTYNEKLQWMKLYYRKPLLTKLVDKYEVRSFVKERIGEEYLIPVLGLWDSVDAIDFGSLPEQFVLKCTHDSGGLVICRDKSKLDVAAAKEKLAKSMQRNYYWHGREWPYKAVVPRIVAEKYMVDESGYELKDYKFFCFDGKVRFLYVATDRNVEGEETKFDFFDEHFVHLPVKNGHPNAAKPIKQPQSFEEMKRLAELMSVGFPHVRVDFYDINGKVYFGEMTFYHMNGLTPFEPEEWDRRFGDMMTLPEKER